MIKHFIVGAILSVVLISGCTQQPSTNNGSNDSGQSRSTDPAQFCETDSDCIATSHFVSAGDFGQVIRTGCLNKNYIVDDVTTLEDWLKMKDSWLNETVECVCWQYGTEKICELKEWHE